MPRRPRLAISGLALAGLLVLPGVAVCAALPGARTVGGTVRLPDAGGGTLGGSPIVRTALTAGESSEQLPFSVTLRMRDLEGLQARVAAGGRVTQQELEASYLPLRTDYDRVAAWLSAQGFTQTIRDRMHTAVFATGSVAQVSRAFGISFARVAAADGECTSAVSEPSVPADLAGVILSVNGLQPQLRMRHIAPAAPPVPDDLVNGYVSVTPDNLSSAYNIPSSATGSGQVIAIIGETTVPAGDLSTFWSSVGVSQTPSNVVTVGVGSGPPANPTSAMTSEVCLDVEWAGAMAPAAGIRLYVGPDMYGCLVQIQNDLPSYPNMRVVSISYSYTEANEPASVLRSFAQTMASIASAGVSILASSGDSGTNPTGNGGPGQYSASAPLTVCYPASDPNVTGVAGTTAGFTGNWAYTGEVVWDELASTSSASGGGVSSLFSKPSWQTGGAVLAGQSMRCVPDVAAISSANLTSVYLGAKYLPYTGTDTGLITTVSGATQFYVGTSVSCPVWAAIAALVNQARAAAGQGSVGLLNPVIYPLAGTGAFNDVTSGTNGAYSAGAGYDLCSGIGSPNVGNLLAAIAAKAPAQRLVNISVRSLVETGANITIAGFVIQGAPGTTKSILVRGVGPALTAFAVAGALSNTVLSVYDMNSVLIASDAGWGNPPAAGTSPVPASFRQATASDMSSVGAFGFAAGSGDSAMALTLPPGNYTVETTGAGGTIGVALTEVYELDTSDPEVFANISSRCFVGTGSGVAISGFVIGGTQPEKLLVRGIGPALAGFGLSGTLASPTLSLFDTNSVLIASNTAWGSAPVAGTSPVAAAFRQATAADMSSLGAFSLAAGSADCAMVVTLPPGTYSAVVSGVGGTTGTALVEVYKF